MFHKSNIRDVSCFSQLLSKKRGFDSDRYVREQSRAVLARIKKFQRLYLEFGGKLVYDNHASRVLPGYKKTNKIKILQKLGKLKIIYCINSKDLESGKFVGKSKYTYEKQVLKDLCDLKKYGFTNIVIVIMRFTNGKKTKVFAQKLSSSGKEIYFHKDFKGYTDSPKNAIKSFEIQPYIPIKENLIILTGPAGNSGKMATALCQIYKEEKMTKIAKLSKKLNKPNKFFLERLARERKSNSDQKSQPVENIKFSTEFSSGFAKFETFPIWNLPVNHPINLAYEAATADLQDEVLVDPYYKKFYKKIAANYNRDINNFGILQKICQLITKQKFPFGYKSPTDMGVNMAKVGIIDDEVCKKASVKEIYRRQKFYQKQYKKGKENIETIKRMDEIISKLKEAK